MGNYFQRLRAFFALIALAVTLTACTAAPSGILPSVDGAERDTAISTAILALNGGDCTTAFNAIQPAYLSKYSNNEVRLLMGESYACLNGYSFFPALQSLLTNAATLSSAGGLWLMAAQEYPSSLVQGDHVVEYGNGAIDALLTVFASGKAPIAGRTINSTSLNPGSTDYTDRTQDSNFMLFFATLQSIGGILNRYGNPTATHHPSIFPHSLPSAWMKAATIDTNGVALASAAVNLIDSLQVLVTNLSGPVAQQMVQIKSLYQTAIFNACNAGCTGGSGSGCTIAAGCTGCPFSVRDRNVFTNVVTDPTACAAAGVLNMIDSDIATGWQ
ncbi:MAG: hypothetical protein ACXWP5_03725 [Bdellovibrionota bacterium]